MRLKGISPIVSTVILILVVVTLASIVAPWAYELVTNTTGNIDDDTTSDIECQNAGYDFVTTYGIYGVEYNFTLTAHNLNASIRNTGTVTLYNFYFEIRHNTTNITYWNTTTATSKTKSSPLKPSETSIIAANITMDLNGTLNEVSILNEVCPGKSITNDNF